MPETRLRTLLARVRRRLVWIGGTASLCWAITTAVVVVLLSAWVDLLWDLSPRWRIAASIAAAGIGLTYLVVVLIRTIQASQYVQAARRLDQAARSGGMIVSGWELSFHSTAASSEAAVLTSGLAKIAVEQATNMADKVSLAQAVSPRPLRRGVGALAVLIAIVSLAAFFLPSLARTEIRRFLDPHGDVPPFSRVQFQVEPGDTRVIYGQGLEVHVVVTQGIVEQVELVVDEGTGQPETLPMFPEPGNSWRTTLTRITQPATYFVRAERARSVRYRIDVTTVPRIESVRFRVSPPAYTREATYEGPLPRDGLVGLAGTNITVWATSNRPLSGGKLELQCGGGSEQVLLEPTTANGNEVVGSFCISAAGKFQLNVSDIAHQPSPEPYGGSITLLEDQRPFVRLLAPRPVSLATPHAKLPIAMIAEDDYGISRLQLYRSLNDSRPLPMDLDLPSPPRRRVHEQTQLPLEEYGLSPGDEIKLFVRVEDNDPAGSKGAESKVAIVRIISQADFERMLQTQQGLEVLMSKYQAARRRMEQMEERIRRLREKLAQADPDSAAADAIRNELRELIGQLKDNAKAIEESAKHLLPYDADKNLSEQLRQLANQLNDAGKALDSAASNSSLTNQQLSEALRKAAEQLSQSRQQFQEQALLPLELLAKVYPLMQDAARFTDLALRQRDLSLRLASLKGKDGMDDPATKVRMRELEEEQRRLSDELEELLNDIDDHANQLPDEEMFDQLRSTAKQFVEAARASGAAEAMSAAESALAEFSGTRAFEEATRAADILEGLLSKCDGMGGAGKGCLTFNPSLSNCLGNTAQQLLAQAGFGRGFGPGMGQGFGGGYSARRGGMSSLGLYGGLPGVAGAGSPLGSGAQALGTANPGSLTTIRGPDSPSFFESDATGSATASGEAMVPAQYRRRVGQYFLRIAEETSEN